jgi:catechol 2,3-dioxygenase-like lactoylglutathione lyase family enzyme
MSDHIAAHGVSHLGIGVTDLDRSIAFYHGVLGFPLVDRYGQTIAADAQNTSSDPAPKLREVALLRAGHDDSDPVIVLSTPPEEAEVRSLDIDNVGTHHCAFWVSGIEDYVRRLEQAGTDFLLPLRTFESARGWGLPSTATLRSCMFRDPDGTLLQLDEEVVAETPS